MSINSKTEHRLRGYPPAMHKKLFFFIFCSALIASDCLRAQSSCTTPDQKNGECKLARECPQLQEILRKYGSALPQADREFWTRSRCASTGIAIMVCCELEGFKESDFPRPGQCGTQVKERIYGGEETNIQDFPWMALIQFTRGGKNPQYLCGGSLINKDYVLTAAHCVTGNRLSGYKPTAVRLGEHNLLTERDCEDESPIDCADPVIDVAISETIPHESYDESTTKYDIALIRLEHSITFTDWVKPVCLPFAPHLRDKIYDDVTLTVAGFGRTENSDNEPSDVKLKVIINGTNWNRCNNKYRRTLIPSQMCAGGEKGKDSCKGDSGGPLMGDDKTNDRLPYTYLAGIVSFGPAACGTEGSPGVYTRVDKFLDWIMQHMRL